MKYEIVKHTKGGEEHTHTDSLKVALRLYFAFSEEGGYTELSLYDLENSTHLLYGDNDGNMFVPKGE